MPFYFRLQNFRFKPEGGLFWTSATKTPLQKLSRWYHRPPYDECNTSDGYTLRFHGQYISLKQQNGRYRHETPKHYEVFRGLGYLQGVYDDVAIYGAAGTSPITVRNLTGIHHIEKYSTHKKWYWKHWEAEGIAKDKEGNIWIGINVKTKFGNHLNYRMKVSNV